MKYSRVPGLVGVSIEVIMQMPTVTVIVVHVFVPVSTVLITDEI